MTTEPSDPTPAPRDQPPAACANDPELVVLPQPGAKRRLLTLLSIALGLGLFATILGVVWYRSRSPLTPARLQHARELWQQHGPRDYNLQITIEGRMSGTYWIEVRENRVTRAVQLHSDGRQTDILLVTLGDGRTIRRDGYEWSVSGLFEWLERDLERDRTGNTAYTFARFDAYDGHPVEYLRSESSQHYRLRVELIPVSEP